MFSIPSRSAWERGDFRCHGCGREQAPCCLIRGTMSEEWVQLVGSDGYINLDVWNRLKADLLLNQWTLTEPTGALQPATSFTVTWEWLAQAPVFVGYEEQPTSEEEGCGGTDS